MSFKLLPIAIGSLMVTNVTTHASDIEIYKEPTEGGATVLMMLDNSGSMNSNSIDVDYPNKSWGNRNGNTLFNENRSYTVYNDDGNATTTAGTYSVTLKYAKENGEWVPYYDRISRLKMALIPFFANPKSSDNLGSGADLTQYKVGLGSFFTRGGSYNESGGKILAPSVPIILPNRINMIDQIKAIKAETWTPTANAYAESGAYMFGKHTYRSNNNYSASNDYYSGFNLSNSTTKGTSDYNSPISTSQCEGYGVYFLTDGAPNYAFDNVTPNMMNQSLAGSTSTVSSNCSGTYSGGNGGKGWSCIGEYARILNNTNNPKGKSILTATVGFGKDFATIANAGKITRNKINADGTTTPINVYNCNAVSDADAKNLCLIGEKSYGYGEGGFNYAQSDADIAASLKTFIGDVLVKEIPAISTGTMSVPLDALNTQQSRGYAYTPILDPRPGVTDLWDGNLKKYFIRNSTVTSDAAGTTKVFDDLTGKFSASTYDIWNTITDTTRTDTQRPDKALPQVGGAFQQVFEKSGNDRNLWVNIDDTLTNIKVNASNNKPVGFTALKPVLRTDLVAPATGTDTVRLPQITGILNNILVFTGFPAQTLTDMDDTTVLTGTPTKTLKNIGGVIHSLPQLVTYGIDLDTNGKFNATTRKDSVLYGSMDGALHLIDDSTGKEQFTFIPKEILDLQSGALIKSGKTTDSKLPYGVDAPWNVYTTYNITSNTTGTGASAVTTNSYAAKQVFASGGLRMGGSSYYNLDITNPTTPNMVYSVGSNYAALQAGQYPKKSDGTDDTTLKGMQNGAYGTTDDQEAFSRMGQSWGKPSVGFVRSGGKKVMVNFLPGGYDTRYETANFAADSSNLAQGNAVYMVRVGEEKEDSTTKKVTIDTTSDKGKLLWWASYAASKNGTTTAARPTSVTLQKTEHSDLTASIVTEIRTVDRNYDGYTDFIYFADLGGRVWRADINNNKDTDNFRVDRLVKLLDVSNQKGGSDVAPRFYERPLFTVTDEVVEGSPIAQITVGTGNRSLPVSDKRDTNMPDAIYSFMDREAGKKDLFCYQTDAECKGTATSDPYLTQSLVTKDLTVDNLAKVTFTASDATIKTNMMKGVTDTTFKHGWYYPFEQWYKVNGIGANAVMSNVLETDRTKYQGMKMLNEPDAQNGLLFVSVYNPNVNLIAEGCSATVQGATQRMLMCLPFGNCGASGYNTTTTTASDGTTTSTTDYTKRSAALAGAGIIDNIITQSKPDVGGSLFGVLQLSCTGADCDKATFNKPSTIDINTINSDGVNRDKVMNPREWWEK